MIVALSAARGIVDGPQRMLQATSGLGIMKLGFSVDRPVSERSRLLLDGLVYTLLYCASMLERVYVLVEELAGTWVLCRTLESGGGCSARDESVCLCGCASGDVRILNTPPLSFLSGGGRSLVGLPAQRGSVHRSMGGVVL